jgi:hypothetical protein
MRKVLYMSLEMLSFIIFAAIIIAVSLMYSRSSYSADVAVKSPPALKTSGEGVIMNEVISGSYCTSDESSPSD